MDDLFGNQQPDTKTLKPVEYLGLTFDNDDAHRIVWRNEYAR